MTTGYARFPGFAAADRSREAEPAAVASEGALAVLAGADANDVVDFLHGVLLSRRWLPRIECQIEGEDVDAGLAEQAELPALGVLRDQASDDGLVELARLRHAPHLVEGRRRADVGVEPTARGRDEIHRHGRRVTGIG